MTKITHPAMKANNQVADKNAKILNYVVDDPTIDEHLRQFESSAYTGEVAALPTASYVAPPVSMPPVSPVEELVIDDVLPEIKAKAESLLFLGKITKDVTIVGHKYSLSTLTAKEHNQMMKELYNIADAADLFTIRSYTLGNALKAIDDVTVDSMDAFENETFDMFVNKFMRRVAIVDNMQLSIVEKLYNEYNTLLQEADSIINGQLIKK